MKNLTTTLLFLLLALLGYGQKEHLEPVKDFKKYQGVLKSYYDEIYPLLYKGFSKKPYARYTSMPSFSKEYAFSIEEKNNRFYIISNSFSENYWYAKKRNKVKVETRKAEIGKALYRKIGSLFKLLIEQKKKPKNELLGTDGISYYFSTTHEDGKVDMGKVWSPKDDSLLDRLVKCCDQLYAFGKGSKISIVELENQVEQLLLELKK